MALSPKLEKIKTVLLSNPVDWGQIHGELIASQDIQAGGVNLQQYLHELKIAMSNIPDADSDNNAHEMFDWIDRYISAMLAIGVDLSADRLFGLMSAIGEVDGSSSDAVDDALDRCEKYLERELGQALSDQVLDEIEGKMAAEEAEQEQREQALLREARKQEEQKRVDKRQAQMDDLDGRLSKEELSDEDFEKLYHYLKDSDQTVADHLKTIFLNDGDHTKAKNAYRLLCFRDLLQRLPPADDRHQMSGLHTIKADLAADLPVEMLLTIDDQGRDSFVNRAQALGFSTAPMSEVSFEKVLDFYKRRRDLGMRLVGYKKEVLDRIREVRAEKFITNHAREASGAAEEFLFDDPLKGLELLAEQQHCAAKVSAYVQAMVKDNHAVNSLLASAPDVRLDVNQLETVLKGKKSPFRTMGTQFKTAFSFCLFRKTVARTDGADAMIKAIESLGENGSPKLVASVLQAIAKGKMSCPSNYRFGRTQSLYEDIARGDFSGVVRSGPEHGSVPRL